MQGQPTYAPFSKDGRKWPENASLWGANVSAGLTSHGAEVLRQHGLYYAHETWKNLNGSGGAAGCAQLTVYADDDKDTHRDVKTARAFLSGLAPQCGNITVHGEGQLTSNLFNQGAASPSKKCAGMPSERLVSATLVGGSIAKLAGTNRDLVGELGAAIGCCTDAVCKDAQPAPSPGNCTLMDVGRAAFSPSAFWSLYNGTLDSASNLAEFVQLVSSWAPNSRFVSGQSLSV